MTRAEIRYLQSCIKTPQDLVRNRKIVELSEKENFSVNCYAYALGIIVDDDFSFNPGFTCNEIFNNSASLVTCIADDLRKLNIRYRILYPRHQPIYTKYNEYLVKVYFCSTPIPNFAPCDFHFIRRDDRAKFWYHKWGWKETPCIIKDSDEQSFEPYKIIQEYDNQQFIYEPVCYIAISYPQKKSRH